MRRLGHGRLPALCVVTAILLLPLRLSAADAADLFRAHCAPCHGPNGDGGRGANLVARRLVHAPNDDALSAVIRDGIPGTQMPGTRMTADENRALVAFVRALGQKPPAHLDGNAASGEALFWGKGRCGRCHTIDARGGRLGPDLTSIGARRSPSHLRQSILDPEAEVPETFAVYRRFITMPDAFLIVRVVTNDGRAITGVRINEDTFTIQLRDYTDRIWSFSKSELRELHKDWGKSPMPSYRGAFSDTELQDLVAYLAAQVGQAIVFRRLSLPLAADAVEKPTRHPPNTGAPVGFFMRFCGPERPPNRPQKPMACPTGTS